MLCYGDTQNEQKQHKKVKNKTKSNLFLKEILNHELLEADD